MIVMSQIKGRRIFVLAVGLMLCALAGCGSDPVAGPNAPTDSTGPTASPTVDAAKEEVRREILAAYNGYLEAYIKASATADYRTKELATYVGEPLLGQLLNNLFNMSRSGVRNEGRPAWNPKVTELDPDSGQAVIQDCFDSTNWNAVGGKAQPTSQAKKYPVVVKAKRVSGKWYVFESTAQRSSTC